MKRREVITLLGGAAAGWPLAARAQQPSMPVVGYVRSESFDDTAQRMIAAFREGLKETGYIEGQNLAIEFRSAQGQPDRLPALIADLVRHPAAVIVGNFPAAKAAKATTASVPIVFAYGGDPVRWIGCKLQLTRRKRYRGDFFGWPGWRKASSIAARPRSPSGRDRASNGCKQHNIDGTERLGTSRSRAWPQKRRREGRR